MADHVVIAQRRVAAQEKLESACRSLADRLGVPPPQRPPMLTRETAFVMMQELESMAAFVAGINAAIPDAKALRAAADAAEAREREKAERAEADTKAEKERQAAAAKAKADADALKPAKSARPAQPHGRQLPKHK